MSERKIGIAITTYNRPNTVDSFKAVLDDERVQEVIIVDDCSTKENYDKLVENVLALKSVKVKLYRNDTNKGVYDNKRESVLKSTSEYVIVFDSDNILGKDYLDAIYSVEWKPEVTLCPVYAKPSFDYREFTGISLTKANITEYLDKKLFDCFLNTMNFAVSRDSYLAAWEPKPDICGADSIWMNYKLIRNGGTLLPLKGMEYEHVVHPGSHFIQNEKESTPKCDWVKSKFRNINVYTAKNKESFVTTKLFGRLGNQCYQIAACIALAMRNGVEYYIPGGTVGNDPLYLNHFPLLLPNKKIDHEYIEKTPNYTPILFQDNMCLQGYFQDFRYFEDYADQIIPMFKITPAKLRPDTVAIHFRAGDFRTILGKHVVMTEEYLKSGIRYFNNKGINKFFICSDDIPLCKTLFKLDEFKNSTFEYSEGRTAIEDMAELSGCKYMIGSASTFTYWAYYLNVFKDKKIILPDKLWGETHRNMPEIYPDNCVKINPEGKIISE